MNGFKYKVIYKGKTFIGNTEYDLKMNIKERFPDDSDDVIASVVTNNKIEQQKFSGPVKDTHIPKNKRSLSFKDVVTGASAILNIAKGDFVPQEEIIRRGSICAGCPNKTATSDCVSCGFGSRLTSFINKLKKETFGGSFFIPNELDKKYCSICSCALAVMLPSKMSSFKEDETKQSERPDFCWVKKTSSNYKP